MGPRCVCIRLHGYRCSRPCVHGLPSCMDSKRQYQLDECSRTHMGRGVERSDEYMFIAYYVARTQPKTRSMPPKIADNFGFRNLKQFYRYCFDNVENIRSGYLLAYDNEEKAFSSFYNSIGGTVQEYWSRLPKPQGITGDLDNWNHQHSAVHNIWASNSHDSLYDELMKIVKQDSEVQELVEQLINHPKYAERTIAIRQGQPEFRRSLLKKYKRCMITHCIDSHVLQACHILPYSQSHDNSLENGLLLRADIHILFDKKLITIDNNFNVRVSENIHSPKYRELNGKKIEFGEQLDISQIKNNLKALYE